MEKKQLRERKSNKIWVIFCLIFYACNYPNNSIVENGENTIIEIKKNNFTHRSIYHSDDMKLLSTSKIFADCTITDSFWSVFSYNRFIETNNKTVSIRLSTNSIKSRTSVYNLINGVVSEKILDTFFFINRNDPKVIANYRGGKKNGPYIILFPDGKIHQKVFFKNDKVVGLIDNNTGEKSGDTIVFNE